MNYKILAEIIKDSPDDHINIRDNGLVDLSGTFVLYLRLFARLVQKGRRGLYSRKSRVRKKVIQRQFNILIKRSLEHAYGVLHDR